MKIKTSEATGVALAYLVAVAEGHTDFAFDGITWGCKLNGKLKVFAHGWALSMVFRPDAEWAQGGPIIEREKIDLYQSTGRICAAMWENLPGGGRLIAEAKDCPTPLIAAMRCYVASKLGDEVEVPDELA